MSAALGVEDIDPAATDSGLWARVRLIAGESWKYLVASIAALAVDYGLLVSLTEVGHLHYLLSAAIGFSAGLAVTYILSITFVFRERRYSRGAELAGFLAIGLIGLGLNELLLKGMVEGLGLHYTWAKIPAAGISFMFNFITRRLLLFTAPPHMGTAADDD